MDSGSPSISRMGFGILHDMLFLPSNESFTENSVSFFFHRVNMSYTMKMYKNHTYV